MPLAGLEGFYLATNIKHLLGELTLNVIRLSSKLRNFDGGTHISIGVF